MSETSRRVAAAVAAVAVLVAPTLVWAWGAISVSDNGRRTGAAFGHETEHAARREAAAECGGCDFVVTFEEGCAAYAHDPVGGWGWSQGDDLDAAEAAATKSCHERGGLQCRIRVWACDGR